MKENQGGPFPPGGIFGPYAADDEALDAEETGGFYNLQARRAVVRQRATMLLVERFVHEWPETVSWTKAEVRRSVFRRLGVSDLDDGSGVYMPSTTFVDSEDAPEKLTVRLAMKVAVERQVDRAVSATTRFLGSVLYETYAHHDVARWEAQRRLAGTSRHEAVNGWITMKMDAVAERLGRLWKRGPKPEDPIS